MSEENKTCPTCGRDDFKNKRGMKVHHSKTHGESIAGDKVECDQCGDEFRITPNRVKNDDNHFCNKECYAKYSVSDKIINQYPEYDGGKVEVECDFCESYFETKPYKVSQKQNNFCSRDCYSGYLENNNNGKEHPSYSGRITVPCGNCGTDKEVTPSEFERSENHFCNKECMSEWRSDNLVGEDAPAWSGGTARQNYGSGWSKQREKALERDFHRCRMCNMSEEKSKEKYNQGLHVHHRTPFKLFESSKKANRLRNLISLCKSCHHTLEWEFSGR